ncbi:MAG: hypothetical protein RPU59_06370 [Candidatus Sedimenticola sp. (ex Thyasira tokunagai)]
MPESHGLKDHGPLLFIFGLLFWSSGFGAPVDFKQVLEDAAFRPAYSSSRVHFYVARHQEMVKDILTPSESQSIHRYTLAPDGFGARTAVSTEAFAADSVALHSALEKLPGASSMGVAEIYSVQAAQYMPLKSGDYVVAHGRPWSFSEDVKSTSSYFTQKMRSPGRLLLYRVDQPLHGKPVGAFSELPQEAEILYTYGSSFQVMGMETKQITKGRLAGHEFTEVQLIETTGVPLDGTVHYYKGGADNAITPGELATDFQIDDRLRVRTYSPPSGCYNVSK